MICRNSATCFFPCHLQRFLQLFNAKLGTTFSLQKKKQLINRIKTQWYKCRHIFICSLQNISPRPLTPVWKNDKHPRGAWRGVWNRQDSHAKTLLAGEILMQFHKAQGQCVWRAMLIHDSKGINISLDAGRVCGKKYTCTRSTYAQKICNFGVSQENCY